MTQISKYLKKALLNATLRNVPYTSPSTVYVALYTSDPTDSDTGVEATGGAYARQPISFVAATDPGNTNNTANVPFPQATANWGTITHIGIRDALTGGNLMYFTPLTTTRSILSGDDWSLLASQVPIAFS
jgi:hypothetical protein